MGAVVECSGKTADGDDLVEDRLVVANADRLVERGARVLRIKVEGHRTLCQVRDVPVTRRRLAVRGTIRLRAEWQAEEVAAEDIEQRVDPGDLAWLPRREAVGLDRRAGFGEDNGSHMGPGERHRGFHHIAVHGDRCCAVDFTGLGHAGLPFGAACFAR